MQGGTSHPVPGWRREAFSQPQVALDRAQAAVMRQRHGVGMGAAVYVGNLDIPRARRQV